MKCQKVFIYQYVMPEFMAGQILVLTNLLSVEQQRRDGYVLVGSAKVSFDALEDDRVEELRKAWKVESEISELVKSLEEEQAA